MQTLNRTTTGVDTTSSPLPPSTKRLWRTAAQRNVRNQWSKVASCRRQWMDAASSAKSHATCLVNSYLSKKYIPLMELGVLSDMPDIREKACSKLLKQLEIHQGQLLSSYKDMVTTIIHMVNASRSMRCYVKGKSSSLVLQFSSVSEDSSDAGDGGGIPVFQFLPISSLEQLAEEFLHMFVSELILKRLLVVELLTICCEASKDNMFCWSNELYPGELNDLSMCNLISVGTNEPIPPRLREGKANAPTMQFKNQPNQETLQIYLTTWISEVNMDTQRMDEIFNVVGQEMHISLK